MKGDFRTRKGFRLGREVGYFRRRVLVLCHGFYDRSHEVIAQGGNGDGVDDVHGKAVDQ